MKIALVCGHFMPEVGYQEVYLARAFARLGHEVRVFTSKLTSPSASNAINTHYETGIYKDPAYGYKVERLRSKLNYGSAVYSPKLAPAIFDFLPDLVIALGPGKLFPFPILLPKEKRFYKLFTFFGDNSDFWKAGTFYGRLRNVKSQFMQKLVKNHVYNRAVETSDKVVVYTPETENILQKYLSTKAKNVLGSKVFNSTLGFDPDEFYFDNESRSSIRKQYSIDDKDIVFLTSTRMNPAKNIETIISILKKLNQEDNRIKYILIGMLENDYCRKLEEYVRFRNRCGMFFTFPFMGHSELRKFFCAADFGIWMNAAISIQESMGTGLPVILENKPSVNHLIKEGKNGFHFHKTNDLRSILEKTILLHDSSHGYLFKNRRDVLNFNASFLSYNKIAQDIIDLV